MLKPLLVVSALLLLGAASQETTPAPAPPPIVVPPDAAKVVNPYKPTADGLARAKKMYGYECALCHGVNGDGKGDAVESLKLNLKDFTDPAQLKNMTDGELFYIIKNGTTQMPAEGGRAKPEEMWNLVAVVRGFAKK